MGCNNVFYSLFLILKYEKLRLNNVFICMKKLRYPLHVTNEYINNPGHMTKMAVMSKYGKTPFKNFLLQKTWHRGLNYYTSVMTLTYFTTRLTYVTHAFEWGNCLNVIRREKRLGCLLLGPPGSNWCYSFAPELVSYSALRAVY